MPAANNVSYVMEGNVVNSRVYFLYHHHLLLKENSSEVRHYAYNQRNNAGNQNVKMKHIND